MVTVVAPLTVGPPGSAMSALFHSMPMALSKVIDVLLHICYGMMWHQLEEFTRSVGSPSQVIRILDGEPPQVYVPHLGGDGSRCLIEMA